MPQVCGCVVKCLRCTSASIVSTVLDVTYVLVWKTYIQMARPVGTYTLLLVISYYTILCYKTGGGPN